MVNRSKSKSTNLSFDMSMIRKEDYLALLQRNEQLAKELAEMKTSNANLNSDINYVVQQKFLTEQNENHMRTIILKIKESAKLCFSHIVNCSTELTGILHEVANIMPENVNATRASSTRISSPKKDEQKRKSNRQSQQNVNAITQRNDENISKDEIRSSRGLSSITCAEESLHLSGNEDDDDLEVEDTNIQSQHTLRRLSVISERAEYSLSPQQEDTVQDESDPHNSALQNTTASFFKPPLSTNVNTRRAEVNADNEDTGLSLVVEPDYSRLDVTDDDKLTGTNTNTREERGYSKFESDTDSSNGAHNGTQTDPPEDDDSDNEETVCNSPEMTFKKRKETLRRLTPKRSSFIEKRGEPPRQKNSPKRLSFIKRKSFGSPRPSYVDRRVTMIRKSVSPHNISSMHRARTSTNLAKTIDDDNSSPHRISRRTLFQKSPTGKNEKSDRNREIDKSDRNKETVDALGCSTIQDVDEEEFTIKKTPSYLGKSTCMNDLSTLDNLISSTPIIKGTVQSRNQQDAKSEGAHVTHRVPSEKRNHADDFSDNSDDSELMAEPQQDTLKRGAKKNSKASNKHSKTKDTEKYLAADSRENAPSTSRMKRSGRNISSNQDHSDNLDDSLPSRVKCRKRACTAYKYSMLDAYVKATTGYTSFELSAQDASLELQKQKKTLSRSPRKVKGTSLNSSPNRSKMKHKSSQSIEEKTNSINTSEEADDRNSEQACPSSPDDASREEKQNNQRKTNTSLQRDDKENESLNTSKRKRRARKRITYKEPPLNKKLRRN